LGRRENGEKAVRLAEELHPDVVLMDLRMPRMDGVEATRRILATGRPARVLVLTTYADDDSVFAALQAGELGYLTKDSGADDIALAVRAHCARRQSPPGSRGAEAAARVESRPWLCEA
jgi:DNA-binding NarL/FixJ family response regulator